MFLFLVDGNRDLDDPTDSSRSGLFRGFILRNSDVGAAALTLDVFLFRVVCGNHIIWGFQHVAGFRRRHVGTSIQDAWTDSLASVRAALDADPADDRAMLLRASAQEIAPTRDGVLEAVTQRLDLPQKSAAEAYTLGGAARAESAFGLGLRAGADSTQSAHALAGRPLRRSTAPPVASSPRSTDPGRSPCGPSARTAPFPQPSLTGRPRSARPTARVVHRATRRRRSRAPATYSARGVAHA